MKKSSVAKLWSNSIQVWSEMAVSHKFFSCKKGFHARYFNFNWLVILCKTEPIKIEFKEIQLSSFSSVLKGCNFVWEAWCWWWGGIMTKTNTFREHLQRATLETCDLWDIWSEWWGGMTWQTKIQWQRQIQRQRNFGNEYGNSLAIWRQSTCRHITIFGKSNSLFCDSQNIDRRYFYPPVV